MSQKPVILFDGVCNLCNATVQFVIERDSQNTFKFTALQGEYAKRILPGFGVGVNKLNSILLIENNKLHTKSSAALRIARKLSGLWPVLYIFILFPKFFRDWVYDFIAGNRYKWWGKQESCWVPTAELKNKFFS